MKFIDIFNGNERKPMAAPQSLNKVDQAILDNLRQNGKTVVFNLIVLDESGSMAPMYEHVLAGVNETLHAIRKAEIENSDQAHFVTLAAFDSKHYNRIYSCTAAANALDITSDQYHPGEKTPLYDAIGKSITELKPCVKDGDMVRVTVITDGCDSTSRLYDVQAVKLMIDSLRENGWAFTYIGASQGVAQVAKLMSGDNNVDFETTEEDGMLMREKPNRMNLFQHCIKEITNTIVADSEDFDDADSVAK